LGEDRAFHILLAARRARDGMVTHDVCVTYVKPTYTHSPTPVHVDQRVLMAQVASDVASRNRKRDSSWRFGRSKRASFVPN
jgi:hypothetical protein